MPHRIPPFMGDILLSNLPRRGFVEISMLELIFRGVLDRGNQPLLTIIGGSTGDVPPPFPGLLFPATNLGHQISFFVPRPRDVAHPGSGPAQGRSGLAQSCSPSEPFLEGCAAASTTTSTLAERAQNWSHIKMATLVPVFRKRIVPP
jgi:hypothetical protein